MGKFAIKSYILTIDGKGFGGKMYPISTIIRALELYDDKYHGIVSSLNGKTTIEELVEEMIKSK